MHHRLPQYKGKLTSKQIAEGMNIANRNALRLFQDAKLMLDNGRVPSAIALSILSIEESGKTTVLREIALARDQKELISGWREYRQHTSKNQHWLFIDNVLRGASRLKDFGNLYDSTSSHPQLLDAIKQLCLYTDCLGNGKWSIPDDTSDIDLAKALIAVAECFCQSDEVTEQEIDLWVCHMQPVFRTTQDAMQNALIAWDYDMRSKGLSKTRTTMEQFITDGIKSCK